MIICPRCSQSRPSSTSAPDWQCPFCLVAYAKAQDSGPAKNLAAAPPSHTLPFKVKVLLVLAGLAYGIWLLSPLSKGSPPVPQETQSSISTPSTGEQIAKVAASTPAADVVIYTTSWCPHCTSAKKWLEKHKFRFQECDVEASSQCNSQMQQLGGRGIPFVVVRGRPIGRGFSSEAFINELMRG